jgi:2-keto-4-pentenoate hydratase/2-oxohepta-3-ene-1,7-dioic acid hydratase in catechol pathway
MRFARIRTADGSPTYARVEGDRALILSAAPWLGGKPTGTELEGPGLLAPLAPSKIIGVGRNYRAHAAELDNEVPREPLLFLKPPSSVLEPGGSVLLPPESERVDYEAELGVVIGRRARRVDRAHALDHVFGYTPVCDVTARDLQKKDGQWARAKGFDTFCPLGPYVVDGVDPATLGIRLTVDGELRQDGNTRDMVFDVATLIAYISAAMTLEPGDLIATGTPHGIGPLSDGNRVRVEIEALDPLEFAVATEHPPSRPPV